MTGGTSDESGIGDGKERESNMERKVAARRDLWSGVMLCGASFKASKDIFRSSGSAVTSGISD